MSTETLDVDAKMLKSS